MWDNMEVKVSGLAMNIYEIKELLLQTKGDTSWP